jgi:hypothetical protein
LLIREAVSACRARLSSRSRSIPGLASSAAFRKRLASSARRSSNVAAFSIRRCRGIASPSSWSATFAQATPGWRRHDHGCGCDEGWRDRVSGQPVKTYCRVATTARAVSSGIGARATAVTIHNSACSRYPSESVPWWLAVRPSSTNHPAPAAGTHHSHCAEGAAAADGRRCTSPP